MGGGEGQRKMTRSDKLNNLQQVGALYTDTVLAAERSVHNYQDVHSSKAADVAWSEWVAVLKWFLISVWGGEKGGMVVLNAHEYLFICAASVNRASL